MGIVKQDQRSKLKTQSSKLRSKIYHLRSKISFTLIETIVVIAVIGLVIPALFSIIFVILQQQMKITRLQQVKKEGDFLLAIMGNTIRNRTRGIYSDSSLSTEKCGQKESSYPVTYPATPDNGVNFYLKDQERWFNYYLNVDKITSDSASIDPIDLTTTKTIVSSFEISCTRQSAFSPATVFVKLVVCYKTSAGSCNSSRPEETATMTYNTRIKLKNY